MPEAVALSRRSGNSITGVHPEPKKVLDLREHVGYLIANARHKVGVTAQHSQHDSSVAVLVR